MMSQNKIKNWEEFWINYDNLISKINRKRN